MDNLISTVWVIQSVDAGVEPIIYLRKPELNIFGNEAMFEFSNPFSAKAFIRKSLGENAEIQVTKKQFSQLAQVK